MLINTYIYVYTCGRDLFPVKIPLSLLNDSPMHVEIETVNDEDKHVPVHIIKVSGEVEGMFHSFLPHYYPFKA
jgi:hypothetical protein